MTKLSTLLAEARGCEVCAASLEAGPRPVLACDSRSRILIIGQAPGRKVHESGVPWKDPSGNQLREWLGVSEEQFYDTKLFALMPMGFCFPGTGKSGDLPPRPECAPLWHARLLKGMPKVELTLLIGRYAQMHYLDGGGSKTLTENVKRWREYGAWIPLPHPSPRNRHWLVKNPWFAEELVPELRRRVAGVLG